MQDLYSKEVIAREIVEHGIYKLESQKKFLEQDEKNKYACSLECPKNDCNRSIGSDLSLLHVRLGHPSIGKMKHLSDLKLQGINKCSCESCELAKFHRMPCMLSNSITVHIFDLIHVDL